MDALVWLKENITKLDVAIDRKNAVIDAKIFLLDIRLARQADR